MDDSLSRVVLTDCFVKALPDDSAVAVEWKNAADSCKTLIFPSSRRRSGRAALVKFEHDHLSPTSASTRSSNCSSRRPPASRAEARADLRRPARRRREGEEAAAARRPRWGAATKADGSSRPMTDDRRAPAASHPAWRARPPDVSEGRSRRRRRGRRTAAPAKPTLGASSRRRFRGIVEGKVSVRAAARRDIPSPRFSQGVRG